MNIAINPAIAEPPLVVDVDGTLLRTDLLQESLLQFVARNPLEVWRLFGWLAAGKAALKASLAARIDPGIDSIPLRDETLALIREAQAHGRPVYLASGSDSRYVARIAERIGGVAGVYATKDGANLTGEAKAECLVAAFGEKGFDYIGDQRVDFAVWRRSRQVLAVAHSADFEAKVLKAFPDGEIIARPRAPLHIYFRALRPHQWAKNLLVFLPMVAGHYFDWRTVADAVIAFACFCFAASSAYVVNDLVDLPGDRDHPRKATRPFASGQARVADGILLSVACMVAALALSTLLPLRFTGILLAYVTSTLAYSFYLKRKVLIDVITLGGLYALRVWGGLEAIQGIRSQWLLMFCLFLFLSLAVAKRCTELALRRTLGSSHVVGRGYRVEDLSILFPMGLAAGFGAVFVVTFYLSSPEVVALYSHPYRLWLVCPLLLYWTSRLFIMANRGDLHDDPVIFAVTDRTSWLTAACMALVVILSI